MADKIDLQDALNFLEEIGKKKEVSPGSRNRPDPLAFLQSPKRSPQSKQARQSPPIRQEPPPVLPAFHRLPGAMQDRRSGKFVKRARGAPFQNLCLRVHPDMRAGFRKVARMSEVPEGTIWRAAAMRGAEALIREIQAGGDISEE